MTGPIKVSLLDLTVDQVEQLETELGAPVDEWSSVPSRMRVYRRLYGTVTGTDQATVGAMTMRQLTELVDLGDPDEDEDAETANPTDQPST